MKRSALTFFLLIATLGCNEGSAPQPVDSNATASAIEEQPEVIEDAREIVVDPTAGPSLLSSATLTTDDGNPAEEVTRGTVVRLEVSVREVPARLAAWVQWLGPDDQQLGRDQKTVPPDGRVVFDADSSDWAPGEYQAEIFVGGDLVETKTFAVRAE